MFRSKGELICQQVLKNLSLKYKREYILPSLPRRRFDFMFSNRDRKYLLEFDGQQHFYFTSKFHKNTEDFVHKQEIDVLKSRHALIENFNLIRIDYTQINNIEKHILRAFDRDCKIYYSNPKLYSYIQRALLCEKP